MVKIDQLELIMKDFDNLFLKKTCKVEVKALDLLGNLIYNIIFFP